VETPIPRVFDEIIAPVMPLIVKEAQRLPQDASKYTLSFQPFTLNLLFALIKGIKSIRLLITEIKTSSEAKALGLVSASKSMYSEAFYRYSPQTYRTLFYTMLAKMNFLEIPEIQALGRFCCVDGSVFPAIITMTWAAYQQKRNAIKLHLAFELNRMIPTQFVSTEANDSERKILRQMLEAGVTYIADRGYVCFKLFHDIGAKEAYFIIRATSNLLYDICETLPVEVPAQWGKFFTDVTDCKIRLTNDAHQHAYRLVSFMAMGEYFSLITNRFDLEIIRI
jgi:Transposase DDE domain